MVCRNHFDSEKYLVLLPKFDMDRGFIVHTNCIKILGNVLRVVSGVIFCVFVVEIKLDIILLFCKFSHDALLTSRLKLIVT